MSEIHAQLASSHGVDSLQTHGVIIDWRAATWFSSSAWLFVFNAQ